MKLKTTLLVLTLWSLALCTALAQASEGFDYAASASIAGNGADSDGWAGPWEAVSDSDSSVIAMGGMLNETLLARTATNRAVIISTTAENRYRRYFADPIEPVAGTDIWFSVHMSIVGNPAGNVGSMTFVDTTQDSEERIVVGKRFGNRNVFATGPGSGPTNTGAFFEGSDARWIVGHLVANDVSGNWELDLWVDPDPSSEPAEADAPIMNKMYPAAQFQGINIKSEGAPGIRYNVDDILFGDSFADVVADDLIVVAPKPAVAVEAFDYTAGDSLVGAAGGSGWDGAWTKVNGLSPLIADGGIESELLQKATSGNRTETVELTRMVRRLEGDFGDVGRSYWVGWWFDTENQGPNISHLVLADADAFGPTGPGGRLAQIGSGFNATNIGIVGGGNTSASAAEGHFVVAEVVTNGTAAPDEIYLYIDPDPEAQPSRDAADLATTRNLTDWNAIGLIVEGTAGVTAIYDDIRVGNEYTDIVADDLEDIAPGVTAFAFDQFIYASGQEVNGLGAAENGWSGPWGPIDSDSIRSSVAEGGLTNDNLLAKTSSNSFEGVSVGVANRMARFFETPLDSNNNETFWIAAHMAVNGNVGGNVGTMVLLDTTQGNNERVVLGKRFGNRSLFAAGAGAGPTNSGAFFANSSAQWMVARMTKSDTSTAWILDMWVNPDPTAGEPSIDDANIRDKIYPAATFHGVSLKAEGEAGLRFELDDLLFGSEWVDILTPDLEAVPAAATSAQEPFAYDTDANLSGQDGGTGWATPWELLADTDPVITEGGVTVLPLLQKTSGNHVQFDANGRAMRVMDGAYGDNGRTYWVGFWFDSENGGPNVTNLVLADSATFASGGAGELLQIGRSFNGSNIRFIGQGTSNASASEGHFVVLECVTNGTEARDDVYMWIDPDFSKTPDRDTADVAGTADLRNWNAIGLKVAGDPGVTVLWDEIRLAKTFSSIIPGDLEDVPDPTEPVAAIESFEYDAGAGLAGQDGGQGFGGPWEIIEGDDGVIVAGSIESDRIDGVGNKLEYFQEGSPVTYERPYFARYAEGDDGKTEIWMSYLLDVTENSIGNFGGVGISDGGTSLFHVGATAGLGNIAARYNGDVSEVSPDASAEGVNWIVVRMDLYGAGVLDTAYVWVNPLSDALPEVGDANLTINDLVIDNGFDRLVVEGNGAQDLSFFADEVYTGFSFRDVSPNFGSDDPDLLVYEPFNYDDGQSLFGLGGINAFWDGRWEDAGVIATNDLEITEGSISVADFETIGNKVEFGYLEEDTQIRADRKLAFPLESDGRVYWVSFFMNTLEGAATDNVGNVTLRNSEIAAAGGQRLSIGRLFGDGNLGFVTPATSNNRRTDIPDEGVHWMVARIATNAVAAIPDTIHLWIDPAPGAEPDTSTAVANGVSDFMKAGPIDIIRIRTEGAGGNQSPYITTFDELRIATTFQSASLSTGIIDPLPEDKFQLSSFPNPAQDQLTIQFALEQAGNVVVDMYDLRGQRVAQVFDGFLSEGTQQVQYSPTSLSNGYYILRVTQGRNSTARQMIIYR